MSPLIHYVVKDGWESALTALPYEIWFCSRRYVHSPATRDLGVWWKFLSSTSTLLQCVRLLWDVSWRRRSTILQYVLWMCPEKCIHFFLPCVLRMIRETVFTLSYHAYCGCIMESTLFLSNSANHAWSATVVMLSQQHFSHWERVATQHGSYHCQ